MPSASRGRLSAPGFRSTAVTGGGPFAGRIRLTRGAGFIEYPDAKQFLRIAREEGISTDDVYRAYGHMLPARKRRRSIKKNTAGSRVMRLGHLGRRGVEPGLRKGQLLLYNSRTGDVVWDGFEHEGETPPGFRRSMKIAGLDVTAEGAIQRAGALIPVDAAYRSAIKAGVPKEAFLQVFGHLFEPADRTALSRKLAGV